MGYNIEVSFNVLKHSNVTEIQSFVNNLAYNCGCSFCYVDYEFENNLQFKRNHSVTTFYFENSDIDSTRNISNISNISNLVYFLKNISRMEGIYLESIYDDTSNIIYASQYYLTMKMDKNIAKTYKLNKRTRSYSEDDTMILNEIDKSKKK